MAKPILQQRIKQYILEWEKRGYPSGIPDDVPPEINHLVPSYKSIALALLKNDVTILGFSPPKSQFYSILKKIEIEARKNDQ